MREIKVKTPPSEKEKKEIGDYPEIIQDILFHRGIKNQTSALKFLNPNYENHRHDPFLFDDMEKAVERFLKAIRDKEMIGIFSDYDADGIPGAVMFQDFFKRINYSNFSIYIPHRHFEGYGLNEDAILELKEKGVSLLITIDCGIRDFKQIAFAKKKGIDVIVTDHHEQDNGLPEALAVINPKRKNSKYPFSGLCGTGVGFKFIEAVLQKERFGLPIGHEKWLLDMVGLATLSDMVPLTDENRIFASFGLQVLRKTPRLGLQTLYKKLRLKAQTLSEDDIGFMITPRINAASRMSHPDDAFNLLATENLVEAEEFVSHIESINNERKGLVASLVKEAKKRVYKKDLKGVIILGDPLWKPSVLGLVAGKLAEEFSRPAFVWGREGGETIKGSCRTSGGINILELMEKTDDLFLEFGGHKEAGGFSIENQKIFEAEEKLEKALKKIKQKEKAEVVLADRHLFLEDVNQRTLKEVLSLSPFGIANEKPLFLLENIKPFNIKNFGKEKNHLEISFRSNNMNNINSIGFFMSRDSFNIEINENKPINLLANLDKSSWNGREEVRLRIVDIV